MRYEASLHDGDLEGTTDLRVTLECMDPNRADREGIQDRFARGFIGRNPFLRAVHDGDSSPSPSPSPVSGPLSTRG
ncbi:MAG TPA: hypothetical protein VMT31_02735 [Methanomicrobiales archaeon]|jgi:hypothetical protein|nr:hypothetical protein [Methanomicrobiales archaeon]